MFKKLFGALLGANQESSTQDKETYSAPEREAPSPVASVRTVEYDPDTLHGTHYSVEDFDKEVKRLVDAWIADEEEAPSQSDIDNAYHNFRRDVYQEWNRCDIDQFIRWDNANSMKHHKMATSGFAKEDESDPLMAPVHGITLKDYGAICAKLGSGTPEADIIKAFGIDQAVWNEVNTIWVARMAEDTTFNVTTLFGQYFGQADSHPKLQGVKTNLTEEGAANLERMNNDVYFYYELVGARQAAYDYGIDGAQWILDKFGIGIGDFQGVATRHMEERNKNFNSETILHYHKYQEEKQAEYAAKFAAEQGGNVTDDVNF